MRSEAIARADRDIRGGRGRGDGAPCPRRTSPAASSVWSTCTRSAPGILQVASIGGEVRDPQRTIPRGLLLALGTATAVYVVGTALMVLVLPVDGLRDDTTPVASAAEAFPLPFGVPLIVLAPLHPWLQLFGIVAAVVLIADLGTVAIVFTLGVAVAGSVLYLSVGRGRMEGGAALPLLRRLRTGPPDEAEPERAGRRRPRSDGEVTRPR